MVKTGADEACRPVSGIVAETRLAGRIAGQTAAYQTVADRVPHLAGRIYRPEPGLVRARRAAIAIGMRSYFYAIGLGSNRRHGRHGAPASVVRAAVAALDRCDIRVTAVSPVITTPALGPAGRSFANAAVMVETCLDPPILLDRIKAIEAAFGRRRGRRWGPRVIDLDILLWSEGAYRGGRRLSVPHRCVQLRDFVLKPLVALAADWRVGPGALTVRHARRRLIRRAG